MAVSNQLKLLAVSAKSYFLAHLVWDNVFSINETIGPSMLPTMSVTGDWVFISKLHVYGRGVKPGDLVSYTHPIDGPGVHVIKRIIGMPGDFVVKDPTDGSDDMLQVPEGHVWLTGDNLPHSSDSRVYGAVPMALIRGKVIARVLPPSRFGWIANPFNQVD